MADKENKEEKSKDKEKKDSSDSSKSKLTAIMPWILMAAVIAVCGGSGFITGRITAQSKIKQEAAESGQSEAENSQQAAKTAEKINGENKDPLMALEPETADPWFFDMEPVVACLDVPGVTRYVRATITIEMAREIDQIKGEELITQKIPLLKNWLTIYLASLTLEDVRGESNLIRIQSQIREGFNDKMFPDSKPYINNVLFKEFAIQ